jgi:hypothetical protein
MLDLSTMYSSRIFAVIRLSVLLGMELVAFGQLSVTCLWNQNEVAKGVATAMLGTIIYTLYKILKDYDRMTLHAVHDPFVRIKRSLAQRTAAHEETSVVLSSSDIKILVDASIQCDMQPHELVKERNRSDSLDTCSSSDKESEYVEEVMQPLNPTLTTDSNNNKKMVSNIQQLFDHDLEQLLTHNKELYTIKEKEEEEIENLNEPKDEIEAVLVKEFGVIVLDETQIDFDLLLPHSNL